ncbi:MAG TPA: hypothetical protein VGL66_19120 [Caulobacteraceae bacterium]|jgi:hypothetical protein
MEIIPRIVSRAAPIAALLLVAACAETPGDLPGVHYATAASEGKTATFLAGRPTVDQVAVAEDKWSRAVADSYACKLKQGDVFEASMIGALEVATMSSIGQGGGKKERDRAVLGYAAKAATLAFAGGPRPPKERCDALRAWLPQVRADGKAALKRAKDQGYFDKYLGRL